MKFLRMRNRVKVMVLLVLFISAGLSVLSVSVDLTDRVFDFVCRSMVLPIPRILITFALLSLLGLLALASLQWRVTTRRQRETENVLNNINPDVLMVVDPDRSILICTASVQRMFGYDVQEVINKKTELFYLDRRSKPGNRHEIYNILEMEGFHIGAALGKKKTGETLPLEIATSRLTDRRGAVVLIRDITRSRRAEEAIRRDRDFVSAVIDTAGALILLLNRQGEVVRANRAFEKLTGLAFSAVKGRRFWDLFENPEVVKPLKVVFEKLPEREFPISHEHPLRGRDGNRRVIAWTSAPVSDQGGSAEHIICIGIDITEHAQREEKLRESAEKYRGLIDCALDAIILAGTDGNLIEANRRAVELLGYSKEEFSLMHLAQVFAKKGLDRTVAAFRDIVRTGSGIVRDASVLTKDGTDVAVDLVGTVIEYDGKRVVQGVLRPHGEARGSDESDQGCGVTLPAVARSAQDPLWSLDDRVKIDTINPATKRFFFCAFGISLEKGAAFMECLPPESRALFARLYNGAMGGETLSAEERYDFGGRPVDMEILCSPITAENSLIRGAAFFARDVTERKKAEAVMETSQKEKEVLLREGYHRVRNNLQAVSSLLNIRAEQIKDREALDVFKDSQGHVKAVALVYERLCQSGDPARIDLGDFARDLVKYLFRSFRISPSVIKQRISADEIQVDMNKAISCGLLINELLSNSLKHAFPSGREGEISLDLRMKDQGHVIMIVGDDGVGLPKDIDFRNARSLGFQLVNTLIHQLKGSIELRAERGTLFRIEFAL